MKTPAVVTAVSLVALLAALAVSVRQAGAVREIRQQAVLLAAEISAPSIYPEAVAPAPIPRPAADDGLSQIEFLELMGLRNRVILLKNESDALAPVAQENADLRQRLTSAKTDPTAPHAAMPSRFILSRLARNAGQATPEAAVETFLWVLEHASDAALKQLFPPDDGGQLAASIDKQGANQFWNEAGSILGMHISGKQEMPDGTVDLKVGVELEEPTTVQRTIKARQVDGLWRLELW